MTKQSPGAAFDQGPSRRMGHQSGRLIDGVWLNPGEELVSQSPASLHPGDGKNDYMAVVVRAAR